MKRRSITISISGAITLLATIIISAVCIRDWSGLTGLAFGTMLWTEVVFFGGLVFAEWAAKRTEQIFTRSALYVVLSAYAILNIPISVCYIAFFKRAMTSFVIIEVLLLAVASISIVVSLSTSRGIHESNEKTMTNLKNMNSLVARLDNLAANPKCETYCTALKKLSDDLRYADSSTSTIEDAEIETVISAMEIDVAGSDDSAEKIKSSVLQLNSLVAKRKLNVQISKKGRL